MYGTRGENFGQKTGGFDVYVSTDLENWSEPIECFNSEKYNMNSNVNWAPEVHKYKNAYYMFATFTKPNGLRGTYILKSDAPDGEFVPASDGAVTPWEWECLDGTFYVENGKPYCVFCHEHTQILNGTVCVVELSEDLTEAVSEPIELFDAGSYIKREATESCHNVTDGPFLYKTSNGKLLMIWSTSIDDNYIQCIASSDNDSVLGKWHHLEPLFKDDGGHGMIFEGFDGNTYITFHAPNDSGEWLTMVMYVPIFLFMQKVM